MNWLSDILPGIKKRPRAKKTVPEGVWSKCENCGRPIYGEDFAKNLWVCGDCDFHHRISPESRAKILFDGGEWTEMGGGVRPRDFLKFTDSKPYAERLKAAQNGDSKREAVSIFAGKIKGRECVAAIFDFRFMGGSMGSVVGERFTRAVEAAAERQSPFICFSASGGARMQEGVASLLQMAKTTAALALLDKNHLPFISVLTDPTTGGVAASFALIGDIVVAEPKALIGFAGPRVIEQTVGKENDKPPPNNFQRSEFLLDRGAIDQIVDRREMRTALANFAEMLMFSKSRG